MVGETNRAPFDLPEAEGELVGGFHTEYSSLKFALFFLAEYINMVTVSALATTLFLGGWRAPVADLALARRPTPAGGRCCGSSARSSLLFFFIWLRGTLPRLRYDQFMRLGWKVLIPVAWSGSAGRAPSASCQLRAQPSSSSVAASASPSRSSSWSCSFILETSSRSERERRRARRRADDACDRSRCRAGASAVHDDATRQ